MSPCQVVTSVRVTFRGGTRRATVSRVVTGHELRALLAERGISPNQFTNRYADAVVDEARGRGELSREDEKRRRDSATRTAKRWLSARSSGRQLRMLTGNRRVAAKVVGVPADRFDPPREAYDPLGARLESLGEKVEFLLTENARLTKDLRDARTRLGRLERDRKQPPDAATGSGGS